MATQPSSQFAALLRQSKFASFDPAIAQAYTSYGGHAYRGNFGFKRPLPVRHRNATVFVHAVDSRQQQTEWKSAEQQRRWIQMWDEVGATPHVRGGSTWSNKLGPLGEIRWQVDSEFGSSDSGVDDRGVGAALTGKSTAVANINAMPEREFERYLEKLRKMRPAFREYLKKHLEKEGRGSVPTTLWEQSIKPRTDEYLKDFRATQAYEEYKSPTATSIEQQPQKYAGLTYTRSPRLQSYLLQKPRRGRVLSQLRDRYGPSDYIAEFAGMTPVLPKNFIGSTKPINWNTLATEGRCEPEDGVAELRMTSAVLASGPNVVGRASHSMDSISLRSFVRTNAGVETTWSNTRPIGSPEYVALNEQAPVTPPMTRSSSRSSTTKFTTVVEGSGKNLVQVLGTILLDTDRRKARAQETGSE